MTAKKVNSVLRFTEKYSIQTMEIKPNLSEALTERVLYERLNMRGFSLERGQIIIV